MKNYAEQLLSKAQQVLCDYEEKVQDMNSCDIDGGEKLLFESMGRWHANGHMKREDWVNCFEKIKDRLDIKDKMLPMDDDLRIFLKIKFAQNDPKNCFSICEILSFLESDIKNLYQKKIDKRDEEEEDDVFDLARICKGMEASDVEYYSKVFLPSAIFFTYLEKHKAGDRRQLMDECFTLGAGSKREDLFPEVTGLCRECVLEKHEYFADIDIENLNKKMFKMQVQDRFITNFNVDVDSGSEESENCDNTSGKIIVRWYNPFDSSSDNESDELFEDKPVESSTLRFPDKSLPSPAAIIDPIIEYSCEECPKVFSRKDFLEFHQECFHKHKNVKKSKAVVVSDSVPESMISSFSQLPNISSLQQSVENNLPEKAKFKKTVVLRHVEAADLMLSFHQEPEPSHETETSQNPIKSNKRKVVKKQSEAKETVKKVLRFRK